MACRLDPPAALESIPPLSLSGGMMGTPRMCEDDGMIIIEMVLIRMHMQGSFPVAVVEKARVLQGRESTIRRPFIIRHT